jgi:hypothetical protein
LVRPEGSLKPHAATIREFAATRPQVLPDPPRRIANPPTADAFYADPMGELVRCYEAFVEDGG